MRRAHTALRRRRAPSSGGLELAGLSLGSLAGQGPPSETPANGVVFSVAVALPSSNLNLPTLVVFERRLRMRTPELSDAAGTSQKLHCAASVYYESSTSSSRLMGTGWRQRRSLDRATLAMSASEPSG